MSSDKKTLKEKWLFMQFKERIPGLIVDEIGPEDFEWMVYSPYEDAQNRMNQGTLETMIIEFVEMMWSVETDYDGVGMILDTQYPTKLERERGSFEHPVNREVIRHLKRFGVVLDHRKKYIQELTLFVYHQPDVSILKQKLDEISPEFIITPDGCSLCIQWQNKQVIINVES